MFLLLLFRFFQQNYGITIAIIAVTLFLALRRPLHWRRGITRQLRFDRSHGNQNCKLTTNQKSAFIRTAYFNGQYTNQYAQSKFTGHLIYRRFTVNAPNSPPVFTEGAVMPHSPTELEKIGEDETFELEDTAVDTRETSPSHMPLRAALEMGALEPRRDVTTKRKRNPPLVLKYPPSQLPQNRWSRLPGKPLPLAPPTAFKTAEARAARRRKTPSPSCSILCDEEEAIFPTRKWSKPLAEMGDALNWKLSVLNRFNSIQY